MSTAQNNNAKRPIAAYELRDKQRVNNPPVRLATPEAAPDAGAKKTTHAYASHLAPQLVWAGKAKHTSVEVPTVSLHVHERIAPTTIIEAVRKKNGRLKYGSHFQPFANKRDVTDGKDEDLTQEPKSASLLETNRRARFGGSGTGAGS